MPQADHDRRVDYIEFGATDIGRTKQFYQQVFGWRFEDYGPGYTSFQDGRLSGGVTKDAPVRPPQPPGGVFAAPIAAGGGKMKPARGEIRRATHSFSAGRRFPFPTPRR